MSIDKKFKGKEVVVLRLIDKPQINFLPNTKVYHDNHGVFAVYEKEKFTSMQWDELINFCRFALLNPAALIFRGVYNRQEIEKAMEKDTEAEEYILRTVNEYNISDEDNNFQIIGTKK